VHGNGAKLRYIYDLIEAIVRLKERVPRARRYLTASRGHAFAGGTLADRQHRRRGAGQSPAVRRDGGEVLGKTAIRILLPIQPSELQSTFADHRLLEALTGFRRRTSVEIGVRRSSIGTVGEYSDAAMIRAA
jgi:UDP-glucuronate 4-epimerase